MYIFFILVSFACMCVVENSRFDLSPLGTGYSSDEYGEYLQNTRLVRVIKRYKKLYRPTDFSTPEPDFRNNSVDQNITYQQPYTNDNITAKPVIDKTYFHKLMKKQIEMLKKAVGKNGKGVNWPAARQTVRCITTCLAPLQQAKQWRNSIYSNERIMGFVKEIAKFMLELTINENNTWDDIAQAVKCTADCMRKSNNTNKEE